MMYGHYHKGMPLKPRTLLYPIFGEKLRKSLLGTMIDAFAIIAVAAGTIGFFRLTSKLWSGVVWNS